MSNATKQRPNIVLIQTDQWRGDCLSLDGHPVVETPHLDSLARGGVRFSRAYAAVPSCIAARASMMTGLTPRSHGRVGYAADIPWRYETTLAGTLADAGYHTQAIGKLHVSPERNLLGFHHVVLHDGYIHPTRTRRPYEDHDDYIKWLRARRGPDADYVTTGIGCNGNTIVDRPVELRDIFPTCCDIASIPIPESVEGKSVLPLCRGEDTPWRDVLHGEHAQAGDRANQWLTDGVWKYIWFSQSGKEQLFNLHDDPHERIDLAQQESARLDSWRSRLAQELDGREEGYSDGQQLFAGKPSRSLLCTK